MAENDEQQAKLAQLQQEQLNYKETCDNAMWEDLTAEKYPLMVGYHPRPFYFTKLGLINSELDSLNIEAKASGGNKETLARLRGRQKELTNAVAEIVKLLYPNVTPVENEKMRVSPETFETIDSFVKNGAIEQLNEENIPGWDSLSPAQKLLYRLQALQVFNAAWDGVSEDKSLLENELVGFAVEENHDTQVPRIKKVVEEVKKLVDPELQKWLDEAKEQGLSSDHPLVQQIQKMVSASQ